MWPAHGTLWSHLVSDADYDELHDFAARVPLPRRGFDLDHYDVPASLHARVVSLGARPVGTRDVVHALRESGLRVRQSARGSERPVRRRQYLLAEWSALSALAGVPQTERALEQWRRLGDELIARWNEPHRSYHDERHLEDVLLSLDHLQTQGELLLPATHLAAWFHDAIYTGRGPDEQHSAELAVTSLGTLDLAPSLVREVGEMIVATTPAMPLPEVSTPLAHLLDADLAILGASDARYLRYSSAVRAEYAHVPDEQFRQGRARILHAYLAQPTIYRSEAARGLWEHRARENLRGEVALLERRAR